MSLEMRQKKAEFTGFPWTWLLFINVA